MNTVAGAVALTFLLLLPMLVGAAWLLGRLAFKRRWLRLLMAVSPVAAVAAIAFLLSEGRSVPAMVRRKVETVEVAQTGLLPNVLHILRVVVIPADLERDTAASSELTLALDAPTFDRLTPGQTAMLREHHLGPLRFARLGEVALWRMLPWPEIERFWPWSRLEDPPQGSTWISSAEVVGVRTVRQALLRSWTRPRETVQFELPQPYDEVTLRIRAPGGAEIEALDRVDAGSAPGMAAGDRLAIWVSDSRWRQARLVQGTRRYASLAWRARARAALPQFLGGLAIASILGLGLFKLLRRATPGTGSVRYGKP